MFKSRLLYNFAWFCQDLPRDVNKSPSLSVGQFTSCVTQTGDVVCSAHSVGGRTHRHETGSIIHHRRNCGLRYIQGTARKVLHLDVISQLKLSKLCQCSQSITKYHKVSYCLLYFPCRIMMHPVSPWTLNIFYVTYSIILSVVLLSRQPPHFHPMRLGQLYPGPHVGTVADGIQHNVVSSCKNFTVP